MEDPVAAVFNLSFADLVPFALWTTFTAKTVILTLKTISQCGDHP
jgi:hypothetical protein